MSWLNAQKQRNALMSALRSFFANRDFVEVETPMIIAANAPEPHIDALAVDVDSAGERCRRYLRSSPELALKRLLATGAPRLFEVARVARDGERDASHRVEFTLLEWYRTGESYQALMDDCDALLACCCDAFDLDEVDGPQGRCELRAGAERLSVVEAFARHAGLQIGPYMDGAQPSAFAALLRQRRHPALVLPEDLTNADFEELFFRAFLTLVEPHLGLRRPTLLYEWPAPLAALSRLGTTGTALRFELYAAGLELANAFDELVDPAEQRSRFAAAAQARAVANRDPYPVDEAFLQALGQLPPSAGIALGVERLHMLLTDCRDIAEVAIPFGF